MGQRLDRKKLMGLKNCLEGLVKKSIKGWSKYLMGICLDLLRKMDGFAYR